MLAYNKGYDTYIGLYSSLTAALISENALQTYLIFNDYVVTFNSRKFIISFEYEEHAAYMYIVVVFTNRKTGKQVRNYLHRILAYTFCKKRYVEAVNYYMKDKKLSVNDLDLVVDHIDGNTLNNRPYNLRYILRSENWKASPAYTYNNESLNLKEQCIGPNSDKRWLEIKQ